MLAIAKPDLLVEHDRKPIVELFGTRLQSLDRFVQTISRESWLLSGLCLQDRKTILERLIPKLIERCVLRLPREELLFPGLAQKVIERSRIAAPLHQTLLISSRLKQWGDRRLVQAENAARWFGFVPGFQKVGLRTHVIDKQGRFIAPRIQ